MSKYSLNSILNQSQTRVLVPWIVPVAILLVWQLFSTIGWIPVRILPSPLGVVGAAFNLAASGELLTNISISAQRAISGFLLGGSIGFTLGLINGISRIYEKLL